MAITSSFTAFDFHKEFANNLAYDDQIIWDFYMHDQLNLFKTKLNELFRDPEPGVEDWHRNAKMEELRELLYRQTIAQTKYTNKNLLSTYIVVTVSKGSTLDEAKEATSFSTHLVIRTRKCVNDDDSSTCCMIFIDELGNVYQNWQHFVENNSLPKGVALAPKIR